MYVRWLYCSRSQMAETDERSLRDLLLESADDLEHIVKMVRSKKI